MSEAEQILRDDLESLKRAAYKVERIASGIIPIKSFDFLLSDSLHKLRVAIGYDWQMSEGAHEVQSMVNIEVQEALDRDRAEASKPT